MFTTRRSPHSSRLLRSGVFSPPPYNSTLSSFSGSTSHPGFSHHHNPTPSHSLRGSRPPNSSSKPETGTSHINGVDEMLERLLSSYREIQEFRGPYGVLIEGFLDVALMAYECGFTTKELCTLLDGIMSEKDLAEGSSVSTLKDSITIVFLTVHVSRTDYGIVTQQRLALREPVGPEDEAQWGGFVRQILTAYFLKRYSWFPLDRLGAELAFSGRLVPQEVVAEMSRLVFTTLDRIAPQFPKD